MNNCGILLYFSQVRPIVYTDFDAAFLQVRPSVSEKDLDLYVQWNRQYGSGEAR